MHRLVILFTFCFTAIVVKGQLNGIDQKELYLPLLENKRVGVICNQTSLRINDEHLVDYLVKKGVEVNTVFAPEHGFRGKASAGKKIEDGLDAKTGLPIVSLYGKNKKPSTEMLKSIDVLLFDIQDVGARFYTYISTMSLAMEACAEKGIPFIVLDRPNPNGYYVDGPVLETGFESFVGMHPVPVVHGMTIGEYAQMVNGEKWLANDLQCELTVIKVDGYNHKMHVPIEVAPSPNLPNTTSVRLYPSLCFFEGTTVSVGRGTNLPFQQIGAPWLEETFPNYSFVPEPNEGAKYPKYKNEKCYGIELKQFAASFMRNYNGLYLFWLIETYNLAPEKDKFFNSFFNKLAGNATLQAQIKAGLSEEEIVASWQADLLNFKLLRKKYLLYPDFE